MTRRIKTRRILKGRFVRVYINDRMVDKIPIKEMEKSRMEELKWRQDNPVLTNEQYRRYALGQNLESVIHGPTEKRPGDHRIPITGTWDPSKSKSFWELDPGFGDTKVNAPRLLKVNVEVEPRGTYHYVRLDKIDSQDTMDAVHKMIRAEHPNTRTCGLTMVATLWKLKEYFQNQAKEEE